MTGSPSPAPSRRRGGALIAMVIGAVIGTIGGQLLDASTGGTQPAFVGAIGGVLGAALGRSAYIRVGIARERGVPAALPVAVLLGRIAGCILVGVAFVGSLSGASARAVTLSGAGRIAAFVAGGALLVATAVAEQRWARRSPLSQPRPRHGA